MPVIKNVHLISVQSWTYLNFSDWIRFNPAVFQIEKLGLARNVIGLGLFG